MDPLLGVILPLMVWSVAVALARRELQQYRVVAEIGRDLFTYSRGRLYRRLTGVGLLAMLGGTLCALGVAPPDSARGASIYIALLISELIVMVALAVVDLWETARSARPEDLRRQADRTKR